MLRRRNAEGPVLRSYPRVITLLTVFVFGGGCAAGLDSGVVFIWVHLPPAEAARRSFEELPDATQPIAALRQEQQANLGGSAASLTAALHIGAG